MESSMPVTIDKPELVRDARVLVIEDGPTLTHGGMSFGAGVLAARQAGARELVDPHPYAVGSIADTFAHFPHLGHVLPAMGYGPDQINELEETIRRTDCDAVVIATPVDLAHIIEIRQPSCRVSYEFQERDGPSLRGVLSSVIAKARAGA
jgi:predicted GTPase